MKLLYHLPGCMCTACYLICSEVSLSATERQVQVLETSSFLSCSCDIPFHVLCTPRQTQPKRALSSPEPPAGEGRKALVLNFAFSLFSLSVKASLLCSVFHLAGLWHMPRGSHLVNFLAEQGDAKHHLFLQGALPLILGLQAEVTPLPCGCSMN